MADYTENGDKVLLFWRSKAPKSFPRGDASPAPSSRLQHERHRGKCCSSFLPEIFLSFYLSRFLSIYLQLDKKNTSCRPC